MSVHRRRLPLTAVALTLSCCTTWRPVPLEPSKFTPQHHAEHYAVKVTDGSIITIDDPVIVGDSLVGHVPPHFESLPAHPDSTKRLAIALADVRAIRVPDGPKTAFLVTGVAVTVICLYTFGNWFTKVNEN
ncbi:MAG TPA: hypothetical protein VLV45_02670 [Gemmatimonadales bacterium]|nr:hypothetical protein [Gemmatimonadales bacterium]